MACFETDAGRGPSYRVNPRRCSTQPNSEPIKQNQIPARLQRVTRDKRLPVKTSDRNMKLSGKALVAIAVPIIVIAIASGIYASSVLSQTTTTTSPTTTSTTTIGFPGFLKIGDATNATLGLQLLLSLNSTDFSQGQYVSVNITELNTLGQVNNLTKEGDWQVNSLALGPCGTMNYPIGIAFFSGFYSASNISSATPLRLYAPGSYACPMILADITTYSFQPMSDVANVFGASTSSPFISNMNVTSEITQNGYWGSNNSSSVNSSSFNSFAPGVYTVAGGDEWGQLVLLHFIVVA